MTNESTIPLSRLHLHILDDERCLAPGSETGLWGQYLAAVRDMAGVDPLTPYDESATVPSDSAAWWVGAYCAYGAERAGGGRPWNDADEIILPTEPQRGDEDALREMLKREPTAGEWSEFREGYEWYSSQAIEAAEERLAEVRS